MLNQVEVQVNFQCGIGGLKVGPWSLQPQPKLPTAKLSTHSYTGTPFGLRSSGNGLGTNPTYSKIND